MKIKPKFDKLHSGEHLTRALEITCEELNGDFCIKLAFVSPRGQVFLSDELKATGTSVMYEIPSSLLTSKGILVCQAIAFFADGRVLKSDTSEFPVYYSVDDTSCPQVSDEDLLSLKRILELVEEMSDKVNDNDDYITTSELRSALSGKSDTGHTHEEYLTAKDLPEIPEVPEIPENVSAFTNDAGYVNSEELNAALSKKQDMLIVDSVPEKNSTNPVSSGGVFEALSLAGVGAVTSVNGKTGAVSIDAEDVGAIPDSVKIPDALSELVNDMNFVKADELNAALSGKSDTGHTHEEYLTANDLPEIPEVPEIPENVSAFTNDAGYVSSDELNAVLSGKSDTGHIHEEYLTANDLPEIPEVPEIPENVSAFTNDAGYVSSDELTEVLSGKSDTGHTHTEYAEVGDIPQNISALNNDVGFINEERLSAALLTKSDTGHTHSEYVRAEDIPTVSGVPENISAFINDAGYVSSEQMSSALAQKSDVGHTHSEYMPVSQAASSGYLLIEGYIDSKESSVDGLTAGTEDVFAAHNSGKRVYLKLDASNYSGVPGNEITVPLVAVVPGVAIFEAIVENDVSAMMVTVIAMGEGSSQNWVYSMNNLSIEGKDTFCFNMNSDTKDLESADGKTVEELYDFIAAGKMANIIIRKGNTEYRAVVSDKLYSGKYYITAYSNLMLTLYIWELKREKITFSYEFSLGLMATHIENLEKKYVVDSGSADMWHWCLWNDGEVEFTCIVSIDTSINNPWQNSSLYTSAPFPSSPLDFPAQFDGIPVITSSLDGEYPAILINGGTAHSESALGSFRLISPAALNESKAFSVHVRIKGRLKEGEY